MFIGNIFFAALKYKMFKFSVNLLTRFFFNEIRGRINRTLLRQSICFSLSPRSKIYLSFSAFLTRQRKIISKPSQVELSSFPPKGKINKTDPSYSFSWLRHKQTSLNFPTLRKSIVKAEKAKEGESARTRASSKVHRKKREREREKRDWIGIAISILKPCGSMHIKSQSKRLSLENWMSRKQNNVTDSLNVGKSLQ